MKAYMYYLKSSDRLFAITRYKELSDEFELIYDMSKFYKMTSNWDDTNKYAIETRKYSSHKLWFYTLNTKISNSNDDKLNICMTEDMQATIFKAVSNIRYTYQSTYIACLKMRETECIPIEDKYINALYCIGKDEKHLKIDEYLIWLDLYGDIIKSYQSKESKDTSIEASRLLGIYKYNNLSSEENHEILYYD